MSNTPLPDLVIGMNPGGKFIVDNSALAAYYGCSTAGFLRYLMGLTGPNESAALNAGSAAHKAREEYLRTADVDYALSHFDYKYQDWASKNVAGDDRLGFTNTRTIVGEWLRSMEHLGDGRFKGSLFQYDSTDYIEMAGLLPLDESEDIWFAYRLDGLPRYSHGRAVEEFKTTGQINQVWKNKWKLASQLTGYLWAARQMVAEPVLGAFVTGLEFSLLPGDPSRRCSKHSMKYSECRLLHAKWETVGMLERPQPLIDGWFQDALDGARKMRQLLIDAPDLSYAPAIAQEGMFNNGCQWCQFISACEMGRQPHLIQANFKVERWSPFADE